MFFVLRITEAAGSTGTVRLLGALLVFAGIGIGFLVSERTHGDQYWSKLATTSKKLFIGTLVVKNGFMSVGVVLLIGAHAFTNGSEINQLQIQPDLEESVLNQLVFENQQYTQLDFIERNGERQLQIREMNITENRETELVRKCEIENILSNSTLSEYQRQLASRAWNEQKSWYGTCQGEKHVSVKVYRNKLFSRHVNLIGVVEIGENWSRTLRNQEAELRGERNRINTSEHIRMLNLLNKQVDENGSINSIGRRLFYGMAPEEWRLYTRPGRLLHETSQATYTESEGVEEQVWVTRTDLENLGRRAQLVSIHTTNGQEGSENEAFKGSGLKDQHFLVFTGTIEDLQNVEQTSSTLYSESVHVEQSLKDTVSELTYQELVELLQHISVELEKHK